MQDADPDGRDFAVEPVLFLREGCPGIRHPREAIISGLPFRALGQLQAVVGVGSWQAVSDPQTILGALRGMFLWSWLVYWLIVGAWQAYRYHERYLSSELQMERR